MGLLLKLNNGDTQLKSLKFGKDRPEGGSSNQPYISKGISLKIQNPSFYNDFVLRGGILAPIEAAEDVARLAKYFVDIKNPSGLLFVAKQNLLSRVGTKTEASKGLGYAGGALNEGAYTPLSTLAEAGIVWAGGHLNKQGLDPTGLISNLSINKYQDVISQNQLTGRIDINNNRLVRLATLIPSNNGENNFAFVKGYNLNPTLENNVLISYGGGSDSNLGIGKTKIKFATGNDGVPLKTLIPKPKDYLVGKQEIQIERTKFITPIQASEQYIYLSPNGVTNFENLPNFLITDGKNSYQYNFNYSVYKVNNSGNITLEVRDDIKDYLSQGKDINKINQSLFQLPVGASYKFNSISAQQITITASNGNNGLINPQGYISYAYNFTPEQNIYQSGSLLPAIGFKTYLTKGTVYQTNISPSDISYTSSINERLRAAGIGTTPGVDGNGRQIVVDPIYDPVLGHVVAVGAKDTGDTSPGTILGQYSSENTLFNDNLNEPYTVSPKHHKKGYLANLDKNAGYYYDSEGNLSYMLNQYLRGIAPDFRETSRKIRGFNDAPEGKYTVYDMVTTSSNYIGDDAKIIDKIYYSSAEKRKSAPINSGYDLIDFRIEIVNPTSPSDSSMTLKFRAYIDTIQDSFNNEWSAQSYMGRGEKFYKYNNFTRDINFGFTIVADNESNLDTMYLQLNALAASMAPTYTSAGYMAGNLHRLTIGNYVYGQWGIMNGVTYEVMDESPWETKEGKQAPKYIKVSGVKFTPIHNFRPESYFNTANSYIYQKIKTNG